MEITITKHDLLRELSAVQSVVERKTTIPILSNVLFEAAANHSLAITGTDLDQSMRTSCPAKVKTPGVAAIPARKLYDYVKLLGDCDITLKLLENHWIQLRAGRSNTKMISMAASSFPKIPVFPATALRLPAAAMRSMVSKAMCAVSFEESRYMLRGALLIIKSNSMAMVSTDGHRLAFVDVTTPIEGVSVEQRILVPRKALTELESLLSTSENEHLEFANDEATLFFRFAGRVLTSRKLTGQFPNFEAVLPKEHTIEATVRTRELTQALSRVVQFADDRSQTVKFRLENNELKITSSSAELGESEETLDTAYAHTPLTICFNANYVRDFLKAIADTETLSIKFKDSNSAGEMAPCQAMPDTKYRMIIMPVRG